MLTESDIQLTTQASRSLRTATLTGSRPTGISAVKTGEPEASWKMDRVAFGVLTASRRVPSGVKANGWICGPSKFRYGTDGKPCAEATGVKPRLNIQSAAADKVTIKVSSNRTDLT